MSGKADSSSFGAAPYSQTIESLSKGPDCEARTSRLVRSKRAPPLEPSADLVPHRTSSTWLDPRRPRSKRSANLRASSSTSRASLLSHLAVVHHVDPALPSPPLSIPTVFPPLARSPPASSLSPTSSPSSQTPPSPPRTSPTATPSSRATSNRPSRANRASPSSAPSRRTKSRPSRHSVRSSLRGGRARW